jgi:hypothetical protein
MKKFLLGLTLIGVSISPMAQTIQAPSTADNLIATGQTNVLRTKTASIESGNLTVDAVVWQGSTSSLWWERNNGGVISSGLINLQHSGLQPDVAVSSNGDSILVVYRKTHHIYSEAFGWNGTNYVLNSFVPISPNLSTQGYSFGNTKLAIDENDNVIVVYGTSNASPNKGFWAKAGRVSGTWRSYPNIFNAYQLAAYSGINNLSVAVSADVAMYTPNTGADLSFFILSYKTSIGTSVLDQIRVKTVDVQSNVTSSLVRQNLRTGASAEWSYGWPSIDADWYPYPTSQGSSIDKWAAAVVEKNLLNSKSELAWYTGGSSGGFTRNVLQMDASLILCDKRNPDIAYVNDFGSIVFEVEDCATSTSTALNDRDVVNSHVDIRGNQSFFGLNSPKRINDASHWSSNQTQASVGSRGASTTVIAAYYDGPNQEMRYRRYNHSTSFRSKQLSDLEEENSFSLYPNPLHKELLHISIETEEQGVHYTISVIDALGKIQKQVITNNNNYALELGELKTGIYTIQLRDERGGKLMTKKLVKR